ncbi:hypothetical protein MMC14_002667 [Varicellaria rhodocarpa]|nr:hypothetical protein [Varicellaria rhodocarpa]
MASIILLDPNFDSVKTEASRSSLLNQIKQAEKKNFPRNEVFDFDMELNKRNTELTVVVDMNAELSGKDCVLFGYLVCTRLPKTAMLSKICVLQGYRRHGVARRMLNDLNARLQSQGCTSIQLWVDEVRIPANRLYQSLGFVDVDRVQNYYAPGRTGLKMKLDLQNS